MCNYGCVGVAERDRGLGALDLRGTTGNVFVPSKTRGRHMRPASRIFVPGRTVLLAASPRRRTNNYTRPCVIMCNYGRVGVAERDRGLGGT